MIAIDLSKQQELDAVPETIQLINSTGNLNRNGNITILVISIISSKCKNENEKIFKEEESIENSWFN